MEVKIMATNMRTLQSNMSQLNEQQLRIVNELVAFFVKESAKSCKPRRKTLKAFKSAYKIAHDPKVKSYKSFSDALADIK